MNYTDLEAQIVARLSPFATVGVEVVAIPEVESDRKKPSPTKAKFTVIYAGSEYPVLNSTAQISQDEKIFISVLIESTHLRGARGVYTLIPILRKALIGFKPTGCTRIQIVKHHTVGQPEAERKDNLWSYQVVFQTTSIVVEDFEEDLTVLLTQITFKDGTETIVIPPPPGD